MDLVVVEGSQGVSRHGVRSWCGVVGGTWQRFPEIASENEQKLSLRGVHSACQARMTSGGRREHVCSRCKSAPEVGTEQVLLLEFCPDTRLNQTQ